MRAKPWLAARGARKGQVRQRIAANFDITRALQRGNPREQGDFVVCDLFRNKDGFTTLGAAVAILLACSLLFFGLFAARAQSRAAGVQSLADAAALAAQNEVSEFVLSVKVADATLLSMSLTGISLLGLGTACSCVPGAQAAGAKLLNAGRAVITKREEVAKAQESALNAAQDALPLAAQAQAQAVISENEESLGMAQLGYVELSPQDAPAVSCSGSSKAASAAQKALDESEGIARQSQEAEEASQGAADAKRAGWLADCGAYPEGCARERAEALSGIAQADNPMASSPNTWSYSMALKRARVYYAYRAAHEQPLSSSVEEQARSALRQVFYDYSLQKVNQAHASESADGSCDIDLPILPKNTSEMKETTLYTSDSFPVSQGKLHAWKGCPGASGLEGHGSLAALDAGAYEQCEICGLDAVSMGKVAAASTSIDNGFEHYFRLVAESARDYVAEKSKANNASSAVKSQVEGVFDALEDALAEAVGARVEAYPPGRSGALVALVSSSTQASSPSSFFEEVDLGSFSAISASIMVEDSDEDALASLLDDVENEFSSLLTHGGDVALSLWSSVLKAYGKGADGLRDAVKRAIDVVPLASASGLGDWAANAFCDLLENSGLEPANTASAKAIVSNTAQVASAGDGPVARAVAAAKGDP